jgi:hypothetical protein
MRAFLSILIITSISTGCAARKIITVPAGAAVKTTVKTTGSVAAGTTKALIPNGGRKQ